MLKWQNSRPIASAGQKIGLLGGSFNPPHQGHFLIAKRALQFGKLDQIWWIPALGNPLKSPPPPIEKRAEWIAELGLFPQMKIANLEARFQTPLTIDLIRALHKHYPKQRFVWICGADILAELSLWDEWTRLVESIPMMGFARPGYIHKVHSSKFAKRYAQFRLPSSQAAKLPLMRAPAWTLITGETINISSTKLRADLAR